MSENTTTSDATINTEVEDTAKSIPWTKIAIGVGVVVAACAAGYLGWNYFKPGDVVSTEVAPPMS